jgi:hypothetical protein
MLDEMEDSEDISETITVQETEPEHPKAAEEVQEIPKVITPQKNATSVTPPAENLKDKSKVISQPETAPEISIHKIDVSTKKSIERLNALTKKFADKEEEVFEDVLIGSHKVKLTIPKHIIKQGASSGRESANKLAGYWAAQIMKNNKQLTGSPLIDPVAVWNEIKDAILSKMNISSTSNSTLAAL